MSSPGDYPIGQRGIKGHGCTRGVHAYAKPKWDQALPSSICAVLEEFDDVFPYDLPLGLPPVHEGHEFKIDLEDEVPPVHCPLYKMSLLRQEEAKKQIESMLKHGFV